MNHVALILYLSNSFNSRCVPTVPAHMPVLCLSDNAFTIMNFCVLTSADITRGILPAVGTQPSRNGVDIHSISDKHSLLAHIQ